MHAPHRSLPAAILAAAALTAGAALSACAAAGAASPAAPAAAAAPRPAEGPYAALVAAPDRTEADRALDAGRKPAELLAFMQVRPGQRVAELGAADGYTAELLARAVAPGGTVYAQNSRVMIVMMDNLWSDRLKRPAMAGVVRVDREFESPLPPEATGLDLVVMHAIYHDTIWLRVDRQKMLASIRAALRPGGALVIVDNTARPGGDPETPYTHHRVEEAVVRADLAAAGFRLDGEAGFLRNPADTLDWVAAPNEAGEKRGTSDRFVLRFVRPD